ncbi:ead/Ea22-like family protein [Enterobacter hormaechei]|uniref:ead/Ea22-like family protein n=1 Tax=Enterobacter hormaechei TaxID=158836 RepID=UPI000A87760C|nr:ead/Ea22-like family protein [Enterobacter hormaechei]
MSNIDKQALRDIASSAESAPLWYAVGVFGEVVDSAKPEWKPVHEFCKTFTAGRVLALLDELEAKDKQIDDLKATAAHSNAGWTEAHGQEARAEAAEKRIAEMQALASGVKQFSEFQICHYGATEDYAKGYIDCQNNYNKVLFAAAGKGE